MIVLADASKGKSRGDLHFNHFRHEAHKQQGGHDGRLLQSSPSYGRPGRIGTRAFKECAGKSGKSSGKSSGKASKKPSTRRLMPCVDYGDPGDDPIDESSSSLEDPVPTIFPTSSPSNQPSIPTNRAASGSNKGTAVDIDYEPYEVSGSNDGGPNEDEVPGDRDGGTGTSGIDIGDPVGDIGGGGGDGAAVDNGHEVVPSNDGVPSNDERKN